MRKLIVVTTLLFLTSPSAFGGADDLTFTAGPVQNTLVQLFTSDASTVCNSALEWMSAQKEKGGEAGPWDRFVPLAFHVNTWDAGGYKDAFAKKEFNEMLMVYKKKWSVSNVYAPTVAANGVEWSGWGRGQEPPRDFNGKTGTLNVFGKKQVSTYAAHFEPEGILKGQTLTLHGVLLGFEIKTKPAEGKNRGRALTHDYLVLQYQQQDFRVTQEGLAAAVDLPRPRPARGIYGVAFWVTKKGEAEPLQATGGYLPI